MPDSRSTASAFPTAARAGSRTLSPLFLPTHFDEEPKKYEAAPVIGVQANATGGPPRCTTAPGDGDVKAGLSLSAPPKRIVIASLKTLGGLPSSPMTRTW